MTVSYSGRLVGTVVAVFVAGLLGWAPRANAVPDLYYTTFNNQIISSEADGTGQTHVIQIRNGGSFGGDASFGIAVDSSNNKMYWTNRSNIFSANLDGTDRQTLLSNVGDTLGIALDLEDGKMYWAQGSSIRRADLDGTDMQTIATGVFAVGVALDLEADKVYWSDLSTRQILRANLDGSVAQVIIGGTGQNEFLAVDSVNDKLYWTDGRFGTVNRSNLDGTAHQVLFSGQGCFVAGIALDVPEQDMYWTNECGTISRANFDGTGLSVFAANSPIALALDLPPPPPPPSSVSEPASASLLGFAFATIGWLRRRKQCRRV
jgi:hypothetical protein